MSQDPGSGQNQDTGNQNQDTGNNADSGAEGTKRLVVRLPPRFNPPLIRYASGSWHYPGTPPADRARIVGPSSEGLRVRQRGVIMQDLEHPLDWYYDEEPPTNESQGSVGSFSVSPQTVTWDGKTVSGDANESTGSLGDGEIILSNDPGYLARMWDKYSKGPWTKQSSILASDGTTYGFRFHYNPSQISQSAGYAENINMNNVVSSRDKSTPITPPDNAGRIDLTLYLNRIEDLSYIRVNAAGADGRQTYSLAPGVTGLYEGREPNETELKGIATRGTEYDLEFLFRAIIGRPMPTKYRGVSADIGLIWGTPIQLWLSRSMRYRGRITNISWTHTSFTRFMVPMWTQVNISFLRLPDVVSAEQPFDVPDDGYATSKVMGLTVRGPWDSPQ